MAKRFHRSIVSDEAALGFAYEARKVGSDVAPLAGNCQSPVTVCVTGLASPTLTAHREMQDPGKPIDYAPGFGTIGRMIGPHPRNVDMLVPCRKCDNCRTRKRRHWHLRCMTESNSARRTWFVTLTLTPQRHWEHTAKAMSNLRKAGWPEAEILGLQAANSARWFTELCKPFVREYQLMLKRIRAASKTELRHMYVFEKHKSGLPHLHALIHEHGDPVRHRLLVANWQLGHARFKLAAKHELGYVTKYVAKDGGQPRASLHYGKALTPSHTSPTLVNNSNAPIASVNPKKVKTPKSDTLPKPPRLISERLFGKDIRNLKARK